ncbi:MAG: sigma-70 family RNA polymerase sigma factor [Dehalococcoidia bacterium]
MAFTLEEFRDLYEDTFDTVFRYAQTLTSNPSLAEDVAADAYLRAWNKRHTFRGDGTALSWLLSITHNCAQTALRRQSINIVDTSVLDQRPDPVATPEECVVASEKSSQLQLAIQRLTPEQQQVIFLRFFEGFSSVEVAQRLNRPATSVRSLQYRALKSLRRYLDGAVPDAEFAAAAPGAAESLAPPLTLSLAEV